LHHHEMQGTGVLQKTLPDHTASSLNCP
jgi:hypothetical protein